jgi:hypothetical protein
VSWVTQANAVYFIVAGYAQAEEGNPMKMLVPNIAVNR